MAGCLVADAVMREDQPMVGDLSQGYLDRLPTEQAAELTRVNEPGLATLREYLGSGQAVAFLGAGVSAPLYPLWNTLIGELVDAAAGRLTEKEAATCRVIAASSPESVVEIVRRGLGSPVYRDVLRQVLRARTDPASGRSWTPAQELVCRCPVKAVVTTNYDPGIADARMRVRPEATATGFTTWDDELALDRWQTGDVFGDDELPVLFAHGLHSRPDSIVLATTEYRRAYAGKLPHVLARLMDGHLAWIGFSFADQRITAILREIADRAGTRIDPGRAPRHVAVMAWDPDADGNDPQVLAQRAEIEYGAQLVLYPAHGGDHSALGGLLTGLVDPRFPPAGNPPARPAPAVIAAAGQPAESADTPTLARPSAMPEMWVPEPEPVAHFTGRGEELARLDRWAADSQVALVGVAAWGGAGKTALVTRWAWGGGMAQRPGLKGVFGWSFYADPSAEHWAEALLNWAGQQLGVTVTGPVRVAARVLTLLQILPVLLVLDGLEVVQEGPAGDGFGRLLDGALREVLAGACQQPGGGLILLTSRFPFADLEGFDGSTARMLAVPPFTPAEGAQLLADAGASWLSEDQRRALVEAVDGHALATGVLAGLLADRPATSDLDALRADLAADTRTDARVARVLDFYATRLSEPDRYLLAAISLFARPVQAEAALAVTAHEAFAGRLAGWTPATVRDAVRGRLSGLASWHPDQTISAHPLVRDTFRRLVLAAAGAAAETALAGLPDGTVASRADALQVVEVIELLLDAGHWQPADDLFRARSDDGGVWKHLPAARLGQRAAAAFAAPDRRDDCATSLDAARCMFYVNDVGLFAMNAGDLATARDYLTVSARKYDDFDNADRSISLLNLAECLGLLGDTGSAQVACVEALTIALTDDDSEVIGDSRACLGWVADLTGDTAEAERHFTAADQIHVQAQEDDDGARHLYSTHGIWWADWLARTGRPGPAHTLTTRNAELSQERGWNEDAARCQRVLGRLAMAAGNTAAAGNHLQAAAAIFRDGDYLTELADTLADLARSALAGGDLDAASRHATEAIAIAAPRGLIPAQADALAARAHIRAAQATATSSPGPISQGRDAADAALRLATRHGLAWQELGALRAHAALDHAEHTSHGWAAQADALHARLVPPGLDPDPLTTVEKLVAAEKSAKEAAGHADGGGP
jgi:tetratricopeptide (TPR) repeat protein